MVELGETGLSWQGRVEGAGTVDNAPGRGTHGMEWRREWRAALRAPRRWELWVPKAKERKAGGERGGAVQEGAEMVRGVGL